MSKSVFLCYLAPAKREYKAFTCYTHYKLIFYKNTFQTVIVHF